jgi:hypothetical protein
VLLNIQNENMKMSAVVITNEILHLKNNSGH